MLIDRKRLGDAARLRHGALERFVVGGEVAERAVLIALRDVRVGEALVADLIAPAVAAHDAPDSPSSSTGFQPVSSQSGHVIDDSSGNVQKLRIVKRDEV